MPEPHVNTQGLIMRGSLVHGEHRFEFPVLLTRDPDVKTLLLACVAPPVLCYTLNRFVVRPLWRRHRLQKVNFGHASQTTCSHLSGITWQHKEPFCEE